MPGIFNLLKICQNRPSWGANAPLKADIKSKIKKLVVTFGLVQHKFYLKNVTIHNPIYCSTSVAYMALEFSYLGCVHMAG